MSDERLDRLGRIWGLVGLGALVCCALRFALVLLDQLITIQRDTDWRVLGARMSQFKPAAFKARPLGVDAMLLVVLLGLVVLALLVASTYQIVRRDDERS